MVIKVSIALLDGDSHEKKKKGEKSTQLQVRDHTARNNSLRDSEISSPSQKNIQISKSALVAITCPLSVFCDFQRKFTETNLVGENSRSENNHMGELVFTSQVTDPFVQANSQHEQYKKI